VTRIIAGVHGGRRLAAPSGRSTRPTTDRVRESLFSRLDHLGVVEEARVLDLYAGSGALGLEAMSRGARQVVLVEGHSGAARVTGANVRTLGLDGQAAQVVVSDVTRYLRSVFPETTEFDLVFLDPPYDLDEDALAEALMVLMPLLHPDAVVVVERSTRSPEPTWPAGLERFATKAHGETTLWYTEPAADLQ